GPESSPGDLSPRAECTRTGHAGGGGACTSFRSPPSAAWPAAHRVAGPLCSPVPQNGPETPCPDSSKVIPEGGGGGNASSTAIVIWRTWRARWATTGSCGSG